MRNRKHYIKGNLTVEAAIIISLFLFVVGITMNMAIVLHQEINSEQEQIKHEDLWCVEYFYTLQDIGEVIHD